MKTDLSKSPKVKYREQFITYSLINNTAVSTKANTVAKKLLFVGRREEADTRQLIQDLAVYQEASIISRKSG